MIKRCLYDLAIILICLTIWPSGRLDSFPGEMRQGLVPLFASIDQLQAALPPGDVTIYVITQDFDRTSPFWRQIAHRLVPHRTLRLPSSLQPPPAGRGVHLDPREGSTANLGATACFSSGAAFADFVKGHSVTHLLLARGDPELERLTGLSLLPDQMYMLSFSPGDGRFAELAHAARP